MAYELPAVINAAGGIDLNGREGIVLNFRFGTADLSVLDLWFEVDGVMRIEMTPGATIYEKLITITQADVVTLWNAGASYGRRILFAVRAYNLSPPQVFWSGSISIYGYIEEPPA